MNVATLDEVTDLITDGTHASPPRTPTGVPVLSAQNVKGGRLSMQTNRFTTEAELSAFEKRVTPQAGDVLLTIVGTIGRAAVLDERPSAVFQRSVAVLRPSGTRLDGRYLFHVTQSRDFQEQMRRSTNQSSQAGIYLGKLKALTLPLPPLEKQRRIAAILDQADALRAKRHQALAHLGSLAQSIFNDMFGRAVWPTEKLGDRLQFLTSGSRGWAKYYAPDGDKFIRIQNVMGGYLNQRDMAFVAAPDTAEARRTAVQAGDVLLSITADLGRTAVVPDGFGRAYINQHLAILRAPSIAPRYLADYLESPRGQREVLGKDRGATKAGLNFDDVRSVALPVPPSGMQTIYAERVEQINAQRALTQVAIEAGDRLFQSLQARAFRGEL